MPYKVVYAEKVRIELRRLVTHAKPREQARQILDAIKEIDRLLHIYPQFGQPLFDLTSVNETVWVGVVSPLVASYIIDEELRTVFVVLPFKLLPQIAPQDE